jgi:hypothetical protein
VDKGDTSGRGNDISGNLSDTVGFCNEAQELRRKTEPQKRKTNKELFV